MEAQTACLAAEQAEWEVQGEPRVEEGGATGLGGAGAGEQVQGSRGAGAQSEKVVTNIFTIDVIIIQEFLGHFDQRSTLFSQSQVEEGVLLLLILAKFLEITDRIVKHAYKRAKTLVHFTE